MTINIKIFLGFTTAAALSAIASYPAIARAATFRTYSAYQCGGPSIGYDLTGTGGIQVGNRGGDLAFCPLINDSAIPLNTGLIQVHLNGNFVVTEAAGNNNDPNPFIVGACAVDSTGNNWSCGAIQVTNSGNQPVLVNVATWNGRSNDDGFMVYVNTENSSVNEESSGNNATLWSYDSEVL
jgi:hypothetical protein